MRDWSVGHSDLRGELVSIRSDALAARRGPPDAIMTVCAHSSSAAHGSWTGGPARCPGWGADVGSQLG